MTIKILNPELLTDEEREALELELIPLLNQTKDLTDFVDPEDPYSEEDIAAHEDYFIKLIYGDATWLH